MILAWFMIQEFAPYGAAKVGEFLNPHTRSGQP